jgi:hypothetical protein
VNERGRKKIGNLLREEEGGTQIEGGREGGM